MINNHNSQIVIIIITSITSKIVDNIQQAFDARLGHSLVVNEQQFEHLI